jgi:NADH-quinone oxidoreductase subunit J
MNPVFFYLFAGGAIAASLFTIFKRNPVTSAFSLVLAFFCFAAIYAMMGAHLLAALQVLVYAGAVMVLFVFVIMLLNADTPSFDLASKSSPFRFTATIVLSLIGCASLIRVFHALPAISPTGQHSDAAIEAGGGNSRVISELMFTDWLLPFELTSVLLLAALVGIVVIALRRKKT